MGQTRVNHLYTHVCLCVCTAGVLNCRAGFEGAGSFYGAMCRQCEPSNETKKRGAQESSLRGGIFSGGRMPSIISCIYNPTTYLPASILTSPSQYQNMGGKVSACAFFG